LLTKYIAATLTYAAVLIGIADKVVHGTRIDLTQVSRLQWGAIVVATLSYAVVMVETWRTQKELSNQKQQRRMVQELARTQIKRAIDVLLGPYRHFLEKAFPADEWDRLENDARYVLQVLAEPRGRSAFQSIGAHDDAGMYPKCKNWELLATRTQVAGDLLGESVTKFGSYLTAEILNAVETLRTDEMVGMRLPDLQVLITANQQMKTFTLEHVLGGMGDYAAFDTMLERIRTLLDWIESEAKAA
jgi:hypothetical protein